MKKSRYIKNIIWTGLLGLFTLASCNDIKENDRLIFVAPPETNRAVLVEDFTGQKCINCPAATGIIDSLITHYGDTSVIAVAIHGGTFGVSDSRPIGLATDEAKAYYTKWAIESQPAGLVNRVGGVKNAADWTSAVYNQISSKSPLTMSISATYSEDSTKVTVDCNYTAAEAVSGKLQLWLTEDSVVAPQFFPNNVQKTDYVHNHVFRCSLNGTWGTDANIIQGKSTSMTTADINKTKYNLNHLYVVAFVYNDASGVIQVTRKKIK